MRGLAGLRFDNSYARLHPAFYEVTGPTPLPEPWLVAVNPDALALLDLDAGVADDPALLACLGGSGRLPGSEPVAQVYAGHQFGVWVPRLGDGRAILLGEVRNARNEAWDLHLKGAGQTRFSRGGDGRSVLRSVIREYLGSEALHGLGIPTTRALGIAGSSLPVRRETIETAATLLRLAPSHVRFGTFEYFAARGETARVRELADYLVEREDPAQRGDPGRHARWLITVAERTARLVAQWMAAGFCHGVLNSDNMSVLGLTLDYGPFGFLDRFDAGHVCNHSDTEGRYAYDQQPAIGLWNLARLAEALLPLVAQAEAREALERYREEFGAEYGRLMRRKLGLALDQPSDAELVRDLLVLLQADRVDYTGFFRELCDGPAAGRLDRRFADQDAWRAWRTRYAARLAAEGNAGPERAMRMRRVNPRYVLRNWIAEEAIARARAGDFGPVEEIRRLFTAPFDEHEGFERYAGPPAGDADEVVVSCSS